MLNTGVGETPFNNMLAELNLPTVHHSTLKRREREIGSTMEAVAEELCNQAIDEEKACLVSVQDDRTPTGHGLPTVSSDGGWQRRGTGNNYNSLSGHVTMIGQSTGKCLSFAVAKKSCRICKSSQRKGKRAKSHSCRKNWNGSSKAMEPHLTVKCLNKVLDRGLAVKTILMDDDTSTFSRVKRSLLPDLVKCSDKNHIVKNMTNQLYRVKSKNKELSVSIINYLKKNFKYALAQNKNDTEGMKKNISAIVPHSYGDHTLCNPSWCRSFKEGGEYKHRSLPQGNDLTAVELKTDLQNMFDSYTDEKMVEKLATAASTNSNENLIHIISRKAPKAQHFSGSKSLDYRVSAAVSQKNDGHGYIVKVNTSHCLSPGQYTEKRVSSLDKQKARHLNRQKNTTEKKRRLELKEERSSSEFIREIYEGKTYESGIENSAVEDADIEAIPPPLLSKRTNEYSEESGARDYIVFDLETTGLDKNSSNIEKNMQLRLKSC